MTEIAPRFRILSTQLLSVLFAKYLSKHVHGHPPKQLPRCTRPTSHCRYLGANSYGKMNTCELQESQRFKFISYMLDLYIYIHNYSRQKCFSIFNRFLPIIHPSRPLPLHMSLSASQTVPSAFIRPTKSRLLYWGQILRMPLAVDLGNHLIRPYLLGRGGTLKFS